jgi:hypothetical protein
MTRLILIVVALALSSSLAFAKRIGPPKVEPISHEGVRYVAPNDDGRRAYIEAWDVRANRKLWDLTVFTNRIDPKLEEDVQWVFIKTLTLQDDALIVTAERDQTYQINLKTKAITQSDSGSSQLSKPVHEIPDVVKKAITSGSFAKKYEVSFHLNPFYLRGDFNGDGKSDVALLVRRHTTGKVGIAIIDALTNKAKVLGAGSAIGNGGDDFAWMDSWQVYSRGPPADEKSVPKLRGDALLVSKSEAASALIYWNGRRYVWLQQGD